MGEGRMKNKLREINYSPPRPSRRLIQGLFILRAEGWNDLGRTSQWEFSGGACPREEAGASETPFWRASLKTREQDCFWYATPTCNN